MAAEIEEALGIQVKLIPGGKGIFDIAVDGTVVAAKRMGKFPSEAQAVAAVTAAAV